MKKALGSELWLHLKLFVTYKEPKKKAEKHVLQEQSQLNWTATICRLETQLCLLLWKVKKGFCNRQCKYLSPSVLMVSFTTLYSLLFSLLFSYVGELQKAARRWWWKDEGAEKIFEALRLQVKREAVVWYPFKITIIQVILVPLVSQKKL